MKEYGMTTDMKKRKIRIREKETMVRWREGSKGHIEGERGWWERGCIRNKESRRKVARKSS